MHIDTVNEAARELPSRWVRVKLGDVIEVIRGASPRPKGDPRFFGGSIPWIMISDITKEKGKYILETKDSVTEEGAKKSRHLKAGTLILSNSGTVCVPKILAVDGCIHDGFVAFPDLPKSLDILYLYYFFEYIRPQIINENRQGITQVNLNTAIVKDIDLIVAPLDEQMRIVAEIERQFSRLDEAIISLKRAKANLKRYKAAVLKAAVEGKLTEQWRKEHPDLEPASKLLERILTERRKKWEATEPAKIKAKGREPKREEWKANYKEPESPDTENLSAIPSSWTWATLPHLGELNRGKSKHRPRNDPKLYGGPNPFIQTGDIRQANGVISKYTQTYSEEGLKQSRMWPKGTLCITIAANIANTAILGFDACFPDSVVGFIPSTEYTDVRFIEYFFRTAQKDIEKFAPATAQKNINLDILAKVAIPLPPEKEQRVIVEEIERRLSVAEKIERSIETNMVRTEHFRQSILKKAFAGELVTQKTKSKLDMVIQGAWR